MVEIDAEVLGSQLIDADRLALMEIDAEFLVVRCRSCKTLRLLDAEVL